MEIASMTDEALSRAIAVEVYDGAHYTLVDMGDWATSAAAMLDLIATMTDRGWRLHIEGDPLRREYLAEFRNDAQEDGAHAYSASLPRAVAKAALLVTREVEPAEGESR